MRDSFLRLIRWVRRRSLWIVSAAALTLLFLAASSDLIIREQTAEVYRISVILDEADDDSYQNFHRGVERAALELHADVSIMTLYQRGDGREQAELMLREQADGAEALLVPVIDEASVSSLLVSQTLHIPVIFLRGDMVIQNNFSSANVNSNYYQLGQLTGQAVLRRLAESRGAAERSADGQPSESQDAVEAPAGEQAEAERAVKVFYISGSRPYGAGERFLEGVDSVLKEAGCTAEPLVRAANETEILRIRALEELEDGTGAVLVAADPGSLVRAARYREQFSEENAAILGLYGPGTGMEALEYLEKGTVDGLCITDDFAEGYLAVRTAVERIGRHTSPMESVTLEGHYIEKQDLDEGSYEKILYPME